MSEFTLLPRWKKNDRAATVFISVVSLVVFSAVVILSRIRIQVDAPFNIHVFALINALINSMVALLLLAGLLAAKQGKLLRHKKIMTTAIILSVIFLLSYIAHHLLSGDTRYGDIDHDGILSDDELNAAGTARTVYLLLLLTHIPLAAIVLPFILFSAYRALVGDYPAHKKLARITWPLWFYVAVSGVIVYMMIRPFYD